MSNYQYNNQSGGQQPHPGYPQPGYPQSAYPQSGYQQHPYPQSGYQQSPYPQSGYPNTGYTSNSDYPQQLNPESIAQTSQSSTGMEQMEAAGGDFSEFSDKAVRRGFIKKVYGILTLQLVITFGLVAILSFPPDVREWVKQHPEFMWTAWGLNLAFFIVLVCIPNMRRKAPWNIVFLILFTICQGYLLGAICSFYDVDEVLKAMVTCIILVIALTLFAFQTKIDFTMMSGILLVCLMGLICFGFMALIFQSEILYSFYAALGAILFCIYIVVDTQLMMGGNHKLSISPEEYIFAALNLYLDIVNLFLFLLRIFGDS